MAAYEVLARKYRPQSFEEVVGQEAVAAALKNAVGGGRIAHAYLFVGPRGVGKTSMARILSKALNCEKGPTPSPCNRCDICQRTSQGEDLDALEIDGASHRHVEDVRQLRQNVRYMPNRARYKIYYIDEVHMLTPEAFNTLLKTLEEPPPHVKFIFSTTDPQKLPVTIHSRCQRFDFRNIPVDKTVTKLEQICREEGIQAEAGVLETLARRAQGSLRDAESLLDQLASYGRDKVTHKQVEELLGAIPSEEVFAVVDAFASGDVGAALGVVSRAARKGWDLRELAGELIAHLRDLVVIRSSGADSILLHRSKEAVERLAAQAQNFSLEVLLYMMKLLVDVRSGPQGGAEAQVALELALVKLARLNQGVSLEEVLSRLDKLEASLATGAGFAAAEPVGSRTLFDEPPAPGANPPTAALPHLDLVRSRWPDLVRAVKEVDEQAGGALQACRLQEVWGDQMVVVLPRTEAALQQRLAPLQAGQLLANVSQELLGVPMRLKVVSEAEEAVVDADVPRREQTSPAAPAAEDPGRLLSDIALEIFAGEMVRRPR
jgi:DNA polymerase-3 subunit gamma/tau